MASAFDDLTPNDARAIRKLFLAGATMAEIKTEYEGLPMKLIRAIRDEIFAALVHNPEEVKALANGECLNPLKVIHHKHRKRGRLVRPIQLGMFD